MSRRTRVMLWSFAALAAGVLLVAGAGLLVLKSDWFREKVRQRLIAEVERATGGRTEIGTFEYDWKALAFAVQPFVLHGKESAAEDPLFRCDRLDVRATILSALRRDVRLESVHVARPAVHIIVYPDGSTNLPQPKLPAAPRGNAVETLLKLAIGHFEMNGGTLRLMDRKIPLEVAADDLETVIAYDRVGPRYSGSVAIGRLRTSGPGFGPTAARAAVDLVLVGDRLEFPHVSIDTAKSHIEAAAASLRLRDAAFEASISGRGMLSDPGLPVRLPIAHRGQIDFSGKLAVRGAADFHIGVRFNASGLAVDQPPVHIAGIGVAGDAEIGSAGLKAAVKQGSAMGGTFSAQVDWPAYRRFEVSGEVRNISTAAVNDIQSAARVAYHGVATGPVKLSGAIDSGGSLRDFVAQGQLHVEPGEGAHPIRGDVDLAWEQRGATLRLNSVHLELPSSTVDASGALGERLVAHVRTGNLDDFLPAAEMVSAPGAPALERWPARLEHGGSARFDGLVDGPLANPRITGTLAVASVSVEGRKIDRAGAQVSLSANGLALANATLEQDGARANGSAELGLRDWRAADSSPLRAHVELRDADLTRLAVQAGQSSPVTGTLRATVDLTGTISAPAATAKFAVRKPAGFSETFDAARGELRLTRTRLELASGQVELGAARLSLSGAYDHSADDWSSGRLAFNASTSGLALEQIRNLQQWVPEGLGGKAAWKAAGTATLRKGEFLLTRLDGDFSARQISIGSRPAGNLTVNASSAGAELTLAATGDLRGAALTANGKWRLEGQYPGEGQVRLAPIDFRTLSDLAAALAVEEDVSDDEAEAPRPLPADGLVEASLTFSGPARQPSAMRAHLEIPRLLVRAAETRDRTAQELQDLTLRNAAPILVDLDRATAVVRSAKFVGKDTDLEIAGTVAFHEKNPWDLRIKGNLNLAVLRDFDPDVEASGRSVMDAQVRGTLASPQLNGSVQLVDIAANLRGVPSGIDKGNGVILFQNSRAVIQKLTGEVGGGRLSLSGFVGYSAGQIFYRLQANCEDVRVRTEGASVTVTSVINLSGTSAASLLTGDIAIRRASFTPRTDVASLLAQYTKPVQTPAAPSEILRNMQLDVHVETAPGLVFQTSLTKNIQAEADLRVRGTAARPSLLGRIAVNQGEINFFGTTYQINRGDVLFLNPSRIEPVMDLDLQTEARGVIVTINFSGTMNRMNISYRSDPPLQSSEIIALLAVGRDPNVNPALASSQMTSSQSAFSSGANTILGQAVTAPVSSRLQRFFGVSRLKIDPQLTDVTAVPQARLTLEQQISKDITLTYITNLNKTQEQIVRLQWDLNRQWSLIAVRDENGLFGVDFQYRKRLK